MIYSLIHHLLQDAESINAYGLFSFVFFFAFFLGVLVWVFRLKKNYLNHMGDLPLDGGERAQNPHDQPEA
jgi:cbb3-type cytochrome oxidase subunit 3